MTNDQIIQEVERIFETGANEIRVFDLIDKIRVSDQMVLRDHFAASALQGILSSGGNAGYMETEVYDSLSRKSYRYADAMLKARG